MLYSKRLQGFIVLCCVALASSVMAQPSPNVVDTGARWEIQFYNDPSPTHPAWASQILCFLPYVTVGTSIQGVWFSLSFPDWNGLYYQEGDEVTMTGDYANNVGHDGIHFTLASSREGTGSWKEWRENAGAGTIIGWGNASLTRVGHCRPRVAEIDVRLSLQLPPRLLVNGNEAQDLVQRGQESPRIYVERNLPLIDEFFDLSATPR